VNRRTFLLGSAATLTGSGLLVGAQGTSRVESQRAVRIQVADDDDAYLLLQFPDAGIEKKCGGKAQLLVLGNQAKEPLDDVEVTFDGDIDEVVRPQVEFCDPSGNCYSNGCEEGRITDNSVTFPTLDTGERVSLCVTVDCPDGTAEEESVGFDIQAGGDDTTIIADREQPKVDIRCNCPTDETAYAYGGNKDQSSEVAACQEADNPFGYLFEECGDSGNGNNGNGNKNSDANYCQGQWGWFITEEQIEEQASFPLYAGAGGYQLDKATRVGELYANFVEEDGERNLLVNYSFDDGVGGKTIDVKETQFTVVEEPCDLLNNGGNGVAPGGWSPNYSDQDGGREIPVGDSPVVLAAHAVVALSEKRT